jgi:hypothetical protein
MKHGQMFDELVVSSSSRISRGRPKVQVYDSEYADLRVYFCSICGSSFSTLLLKPLLFQVTYLLRVLHISVLAGHGELGNEELPVLQPSGAGWS